MKKINSLPDKPSDLLIMALDDLLWVEKNPKYKIDMESWHEPENKICHVCFCGSVLARHANNPKKEFYPDEASANPEIEKKLKSLNVARHGNIYDFLTDFGIKSSQLDFIKNEAEPFVHDKYVRVCFERGEYGPNYHEDRDSFIGWIEGFIGILQAEGL